MIFTSQSLCWFKRTRILNEVKVYYYKLDCEYCLPLEIKQFLNGQYCTDYRKYAANGGLENIHERLLSALYKFEKYFL